MKLLHTLFALVISMSVLAQIDRSKLPEPGEPRPVEIGDYETFTLKNGLKVFIIENHKLPRVAYRLQLDRDPIMEGDKAGYLGMVGDLMRRGTTSRTKEELDEEVDFIGASLSVGSQSAFASGLSKYQEKVLELLSDVILNPTFPEDELEKIRKQTISALQANKEDPGAISSNLISKVVYGVNHPYGEVSTEETVNSITVEDIREYHKNYYKPNIAYLAVVGDIDAKESKKLVKKYFGSWEQGQVSVPEYDQPEKPDDNEVALVNRGNAVQSVISVTYPVVLKPGTEDVIPVDVMMEILGGSFSSRLNMNLREDKGFTYGARASLSENELVSRFNAGASVRNEVTDSAVTEILYEMEGLTKELVKDEELELAKNTISGGFARSLESPQTVASFAINTARYSLPEDYYATYVQKIQAVSKEDVKAMAEKYVFPDKSYITIVGKASDIEEGLKKFGEVKYFDTYGEPVDPALAKLPAGLTARDVFEKYFEAVGGKQELKDVNTMKTIMTANAMGQDLTITQVNKKPNKLSVEVKLGANVMSEQKFDGENVKMTQMGRPLPVDEATKAEFKLQSYPFPEVYYEENGVDMKLSGVGEVNGTDAYIVDVTNSAGKTSQIYFGKESGLILRKSETRDLPNGQTMTVNTDLSDYEEVEGILVPMTITIPLGPGMTSDAKVETVEINKEVSDEIFSIE